LGVEVFQDGSSHTDRPEDLDMPHATFAAPDLTTFCRLDELGLQAVRQRLEPGRAVIECRAKATDAGRGAFRAARSCVNSRMNPSGTGPPRC